MAVCAKCFGMTILPNNMDAEDGPECACGKPSRLQSGGCGNDHGAIKCDQCNGTGNEPEEQPVKACPCFHVTPCHPDCTCIKPFMSRGCTRCCTYGSAEQQKAAAKRIVKALEQK